MDLLEVEEILEKRIGEKKQVTFIYSHLHFFFKKNSE